MSSGSDQSVLDEAVDDVTDGDFDPDEASALKGVLLGTGLAVLFGGILGVIMNPSDPVSGFFGGMVLFAILGVILVVSLVKEGEIGDFQQQQQSPSKSKQKVVCSSCGWKNPKSNNYCHDCGEELES